MNNMHDSNRHYWNKAAEWWERLRDRDGLWQRCPNEPDLGFADGALRLIREVASNISDKNVCGWWPATVTHGIVRTKENSMHTKQEIAYSPRGSIREE